MEVKPTYLGTMIALATAALGLVAALAWNKFITDALLNIFGKVSGVWGELIYAVLVSILAIVVINQLAKLADKNVGPKV